MSAASGHYRENVSRFCHAMALSEKTSEILYGKMAIQQHQMT